MKLISSEQIKVSRTPEKEEVLINLNNTIDLKDYYAKIISKINAGASLKTIPDYYILKKQFTLPEYQVTFSNKSIRFSIKSYINLLIIDYSIKPIHISKNLIVNKFKKLDTRDTNYSPNSFLQKNTINLKDYIKDLL